MRNKTFWVITMALALGLMLSVPAPSAWASVAVPQTPLLGSTVTKYADPMPAFGPAGTIPRVTGTDISVYYEEFQQNVLPDAFYTTLPTYVPLPNDALNRSIDPSAGTWVWGYRVGGAPQNSPGVTVEATQGVTTIMRYYNTLPDPPILQEYLTIDQTIHWANPLGLAMGDTARFNPYGWPDYNQGTPTGPAIGAPQPVVTHLHGAEVESEFDGGPEQWFTNLTTSNNFGPQYRTMAGQAVDPNEAVYRYVNEQEGTTLWFHDHALGITRLNVYGGLAAFYFLRDAYDDGTAANPLNLPAGAYEEEIVIQDRQFDTNGQLLFPDGAPAGLNGPPTNINIHPFWNPEFFGDVIVVNGKSWPFFQVEPRRYRLRFLNGSNARFYTLTMGTATTIGVMHGNKGKKKLTGSKTLPFYVIGTDGGLLDAPVAVDSLTIAPGERYDVIVDFAGFANTAITMTNSANAPFPGGAAPDKATTAEVMQFQVTLPASGTDTSFNPAPDPVTGLVPSLRGGTSQPPVIDRLVDPVTGMALVTPVRTRQLVLREVMGAGGPVEVLLNNTKWNGLQEGTTTPVSGSSLVGPNWVTELPQVGTTEQWEIINLTGDAHPIHLHLVQFQLMNRQAFQLNKYTNAYNAAFAAAGVAAAAVDGYGSPNPYNTPNADGALGGNPAIGSYLVNGISPPNPWEAGWKDTVIMMPGEVTRIMVRWTKQDGSPYGFDATGLTQVAYGPDQTTLADGPGYVWHCHILDHEDNEMMRPYIPVSNANNVYP
jgi:spore coat protein A